MKAQKHYSNNSPCRKHKTCSSNLQLSSGDSKLTNLLNVLACILEEPELWGSGQPNGQRILGRRQLLNVKDFMVWLQEDRSQICD